MSAGAHFGHRATRWHPKMKPFIFGERQGVHVINLEETQTKLAEALEFMKQLAAQGKTILFLGTKRQAQQIILEEATRCGMPYVTIAWIGGLLTNYDEIGKLLDRFRQMRSDRETGVWEKYTKKERLRLEEDLHKKNETLLGMVTLKKVPDALFIVDIRTEKTAVNETLMRGVPTVALVDTNVNPDQVTYPIPCNDDASKAIGLMTRLVADAILEGKTERAAVMAQAAEETAKKRAATAPPAQIISAG